MCLTIPAQVMRCEKNKAIVWQYDKAVDVDISLLPDIMPGNWILYISKTAVKRIDEKDAIEIMELLVSKPAISIELLDERFVEVMRHSRVRNLTKEEIVYLLRTEGLEKEALFREAEITRKTYIRDFICVHGIIEFSNYCRNNCLYCGLRMDNNSIRRYRMGVDDIVSTAVDAVINKGYKLLVLQSGEDRFYTKDKLVDIVREIKSRCRVFIFMSIGDRDYETYKDMREAGASGVLYRFETSNPELFSKVHDKNFSRRFEHLEFMKKLSFFIASGSLVGLPGQTVEDLADDLLVMQKLGLNMISMGPFLPCPFTPFSEEKPNSIDIILKMISTARLLMKKVRIPVATALETLDPVNGRRLAMRAGANALMFNLTPEEYINDYQLYPNRHIEKNSILEKYALFKNDGSYEMLEKRLAGEVVS